MQELAGNVRQSLLTNYLFGMREGFSRSNRWKEQNQGKGSGSSWVRKMLLKKEGFPEEDELVMCTVTKVQFHSVFVTLDEYDKGGMIHISEVSPGRIRNIRDFVREGKKIVCKVLRVNEEKGHIDLSLRRVTETQKRSKVDELKQEQKAEKILEFVAKDLNMDIKKLYSTINENISKKYASLNEFFEKVVSDNSIIKDSGLDAKAAKKNF